MPPEERIRGNDRRNLTQRLTSQPECPRGESPSVIIREAEPAPAPTQLRTQDAILSEQIGQRVPLLAIQPAGQDGEPHPESRYIDHGASLYHSGRIE